MRAAPPGVLRLALLALGAPASVQAQVPVVEAVVYEGVLDYDVERDEVFVGCSLACAVGWTLSASSQLDPQGDNRYDASNMEDHSVRTAWVGGVLGDGIGETLTFRLEGGPEAAGSHAVPFRGLALVNGYAKSDRVWADNGRVRAAVLYVNDEPVARLQFADTATPQGASFPEAVDVRPGDVVTLEIVSVYPGARYGDTAISEIVLEGAH